ncbi:hypothetical protein GCM10027577_21990 [Spirosoma fluminis]
MVLKLLAQRGRMYGYEITQGVKASGKDQISLTFGALYPVLHKLAHEGVLTTQIEETDGRLRTYYMLTPPGSDSAAEPVNPLKQFITCISLLRLSSNNRLVFNSIPN